MAGLANGLKYLSVIQRAILGSDSWQDALMDYFEGAGDATLRTAFQQPGFIGSGISLVVAGAGGSRTFSFAAGTYRVYANGRVLVFSEATAGCSSVPYDEAHQQYIGVQGDTYPDLVDITTDGVPFVKHMAVGIGKVYTPSAVAEDGEGLRIVLPLVAWTKAAGTRPVVAWKTSLVTGSSEAFYAGVAELDGSDVVVNVPHVFGQGTASTTPADYSVFIAGPVVQVTAIDEDEAAVAGIVSAGASGEGALRVIRPLDQVEASLRLLEAGPSLVGAGCEFASIGEAIAAGKINILVVGSCEETETVDVPRYCQIVGYGGQAGLNDRRVSWDFDEPLFLIEDPVGVAIRNLTLAPDHSGAPPVDQDRVAFRIALSGGGAEGVDIETIAVTYGGNSFPNRVVSGIIDASGIDFAEGLTFRDIDGWFADYGIDIGGATRARLDNVRMRRSGEIVQSAGAKKFGLRYIGDTATGYEDARLVATDVKIYGPKAGDAQPGFAGPGIEIEDATGARLSACLVHDVSGSGSKGVLFDSGCVDCVMSDSEVATRATLNGHGVEILGAGCGLSDVKVRSTTGSGSDWGVAVSGPRTRVRGCDVASSAAGNAISLSISTLSDYSCVTDCQTNGKGMTNNNVTYTTVANNRDDA